MLNIREKLELRLNALKKDIDLDRKNFNDPFLNQHARGRVAVSEQWLKEVQELLQMIEE